MIQRIRNSFFSKVLAVYIALNLIGEIVFPTISWGLTSGPVSIDQASFEPAATSEMVDLATGDFTYNIPLLDVDGYPINLSYHGGVGMDQDASMVGLGWTLNVGAINRSMRGLPDDFSGDEIVSEVNLRPNYTVGAEIGTSFEAVGFEHISKLLGPMKPNFSGFASIGASFNNYIGLSTELSIGFNAGKSMDGASLNFQPAISSNSSGGLTFSKGMQFSIMNKKVGVGIGYSINTMEGLTSRYVSANIGLFGGQNNIPVSNISYTPSIAFETNTAQRNYDFDLGLEAFWVFPHGPLSAYKSLTCLKEASESIKSYGYLYAHNAPEDEYLMDFNREGVILANENIKNLPITNHTYDIYSATAQGVGFSFRPHRSEVGMVSDMKRESTINGVGISSEIGGGNIFQAGVNVDVPYGYTNTGKWTTNNIAAPFAQFIEHVPGGTGINDNLYEPYYFKKFGNRSGMDETFYDNMGGDKAVEQLVGNAGTFLHHGFPFFADKDLNGIFNLMDLEHYKAERDKRNTNLEYLKAGEASEFGLENSINSYSLTNYDYSNLTGTYSGSALDRYGSSSDEAKSHHISEMSVLEGDGAKYVYGIPVMNRVTKQVTFNVSGETVSGPSALSKDCINGLVSYTPSTDNSTGNNRGDDNYYRSNITPAYASSYLLTAYLSSNYIDRTQNGPTVDDFGDYTKFNYAKTGTTKWRFPYEGNQASYDEGLKADEFDDKAYYVYGERDQWYIHSIESKNFVAEFHYGSRHDGFGVTGENGGIDVSTNYTRRLVKIELYTRQEKLSGNSILVPIKTVHFEYDYSLCEGVPDNDDDTNVSAEEGVSANQTGKLTLTGIYFTYGSSNRGKLHKYTFDYSDENPDYSIGNQDRWGNYKEIPSGSPGCASGSDLTNIEFPYSEQNKSDADDYAGAWTLETVSLPSGSQINLVVESDDYAYVQDVPATKMYMINGFSETEALIGSGQEKILFENFNTPHNYLHLVTDNLGSTESIAKTNFFSNYLPSQEIYFRIMVKITPATIPNNFIYDDQRYEYISGYAKVDPYQTKFTDAGVDNTFETVALKLKDVSLEDQLESPLGSQKTNPITKASWQFTRKYLPKIINPIIGNIYAHDSDIDCGIEYVVPEEDPDDDFDEDPDVKEEGKVLKNLYNTAKSHLQNIVAAGGINFMMATFKYSAECVVEKSWVRLGVGSTPKLGGGHRVKQITVNDNWDLVTPLESGSIYGTTYTYETTRTENIISSGVASYEPIISGNDENAMHHPLHYTNNIILRVNDEEFQEEPFGETIFAHPSVVYSNVSVANISYDNVTQNATGKTIYEFYTAKEFPVIFEKTGSGYVKNHDADWFGLFSAESKDNLTMSQGFMIHINDMHGKFKGKTVYGEQISPQVAPPKLYSIEHNYFTEHTDDGEVLKNNVSVVSQGGIISTQLIGRDIDIVIDANEVNSLYGTKTYSGGIDISSLIFLPIIIPIPSVWYRNTTTENTFRSSVTTKVITSTGILEEVVLWDKGRYKSSKNLLFDENTGLPIVTEINHEQPVSGSTYEKPIYQYDYPAYWMYKGMGMASENWGARFVDLVAVGTGGHYQVSIANMEDFINPGDELTVYNLTDFESEGKFWVVEDEVSHAYFIVDEYGADPSFTISGHNYLYKVIRSGKRNLLGSTVASVTSLNKYSVTSPYSDGFAHSDVLNASAVEYTQEAFGYAASAATDFCGIFVESESPGQIVNPYIWGLRGNWNLLKSYVYDSDRDQTTGNVRIDGVLSSYIEFWKNTSGEWAKNTDSEVAQRWIQAATATIFDREGFNLESKDALGIYSSILLGYNHTLKVAEAVNARYNEIGFDNFEDRAYELPADCSLPHFRFTGVTVTNTVAHSGRYSAKISNGELTYLLSDVRRAEYITPESVVHPFPFEVSDEELIKKHTYIVDDTDPTKYVLNFWLREGSGHTIDTSYTNVSVEVLYNNNPLSLVENRTNIIDGWQRVEIIFDLPAISGTPTFTENCKIKIISAGGVGPNPDDDRSMYIDDIRVQPYNSEMVSYVIDPVTLRLWATLDSRNFATFYQYDEEGSLVRIIQETERGRFTVQENRAGIRIN